MKLVFSSLLFLVYFLPLFLITYYLTDSKYKNICLFIYSLSFYIFGCFDNLYYVLLLLFSLFINYVFARTIEDNKGKRVSKIMLATAIVYNFSVLFIFKYFKFFIKILNSLNINVSARFDLPLPIGISFFTFQIVSYIIDVYFSKIYAEKSFVDFSTYVIMFPQLIAGPIVYFKNIVKELKEERVFNLDKTFEGATLFIFGLTSKVFLANHLAKIAIDANNYGFDKLDVTGTWLLGIGYSLQMYFDFFGYSLMAIGLGKMIGFTIPKNFDNPFLSRSVEEYWRKWHITLSTWFRDYLFYPILFANLFKSFLKKMIKIVGVKYANIIVNIPAMFVVWFATGLWHGANYNFIIWGIYFFVFMVLEQLFLIRILKKSKIISHIYLVVVIIISFIIFFNEDLSVVKMCIRNLFVSNGNLLNDAFMTMLSNNYKIIIIAVLAVLNVPQNLYLKVKNNVVLRTIIILAMLGIDILFIYIGYNDPFLYFRF